LFPTYVCDDVDNYRYLVLFVNGWKITNKPTTDLTIQRTGVQGTIQQENSRQCRIEYKLVKSWGTSKQFQ